MRVEALFREYFLPLYPEDAKSDLDRARSVDANPAKNPSILAHLDDAARVFEKMAASVFGGVRDDELVLDYTDASVHRLSAALMRDGVCDRWSKQGDAGTADNLLFNVIVHGAAYVGACIVRSHGGVWSVRRPLWESVVRLSSRAGEADLPVFHWWLKSIASEPTATLADRYRTYVEVPCAKPEELPIIAPVDRSLPRLSKVRYDVFYKYLRANLPEIRDVGEAFPSPERFAELELKHLDFTLVGEGRMLIVHGPNRDGLHAFWLTKAGFEKSAFWPCDAFPAPILRVRPKKTTEGAATDQELLEVILSRDESPSTTELLWWGP